MGLEVTCHPSRLKGRFGQNRISRSEEPVPSGTRETFGSPPRLVAIPSEQAQDGAWVAVSGNQV